MYSRHNTETVGCMRCIMGLMDANLRLRPLYLWPFYLSTCVGSFLSSKFLYSSALSLKLDPLFLGVLMPCSLHSVGNEQGVRVGGNGLGLLDN